MNSLRVRDLSNASNSAETDDSDDSEPDHSEGAGAVSNQGKQVKNSSHLPSFKPKPVDAASGTLIVGTGGQSISHLSSTKENEKVVPPLVS